MILMIPIKPRQAFLAVTLPSCKEMSYDLIVSYWHYGLVISSPMHYKALFHLTITFYQLTICHILCLPLGSLRKATT